MNLSVQCRCGNIKRTLVFEKRPTWQEENDAIEKVITDCGKCQANRSKPRAATPQPIMADARPVHTPEPTVDAPRRRGRPPGSKDKGTRVRRTKAQMRA